MQSIKEAYVKSLDRAQLSKVASIIGAYKVGQHEQQTAEEELRYIYLRGRKIIAYGLLAVFLLIAWHAHSLGYAWIGIGIFSVINLPGWIISGAKWSRLEVLERAQDDRKKTALDLIDESFKAERSTTLLTLESADKLVTALGEFLKDTEQGLAKRSKAALTNLHERLEDIMQSLGSYASDYDYTSSNFTRIDLIRCMNEAVAEIYPTAKKASVGTNVELDAFRSDIRRWRAAIKEIRSGIAKTIEELPETFWHYAIEHQESQDGDLTGFGGK